MSNAFFKAFSLRCKPNSMRNLCIVSVLLVVLASPRASASVFSRDITSYGDGPTQVIVFTSFFCMSCQALEPFMEDALLALHGLGARITFVDYPSSRTESVFSKCFLYAANASSRLPDALKARRILFEVVGAKSVGSVGEIFGILKQNQIGIAPFDTQPIFKYWNTLIGRYEITDTPSCVILENGKDAQIHRGGEAMVDGVNALIDGLSSSAGAPAPEKE